MQNVGVFFLRFLPTSELETITAKDFRNYFAIPVHTVLRFLYDVYID